MLQFKQWYIGEQRRAGAPVHLEALAGGPAAPAAGREPSSGFIEGGFASATASATSSLIWLNLAQTIICERAAHAVRE